MNIPKTPCQIPELNLSCYGCCGNEFKGRNKVKRDIEQNSFEFEELMQRGHSLEYFRDRFDGDMLSPSGTCLNLVKFSNGCIACPLHPLINELVSRDEVIAPKEDIREFPCDVNYECKTFKIWEVMGDEQKLEYLKWLKIKKEELNHYSYSMGNHDGKFIEEFLKKRNQILN